jgi:hypothetical protein
MINTIKIKVDYNQLCVINSLMQELDNIKFEEQPQHLKSIVAICLELREKLLHKAINSRNNKKPFNFTMKYYFADALYRAILQNILFIGRLPLEVMKKTHF